MKLNHNLLSLFLATFVLVTELPAQIRFDTAVVVSKSDSIYSVLEDYRNQIQKRYDNTGKAAPVFTQWIQVQSPATAKLFPSLRFATICWSERARPEVKDVQNIAIGLQTTVGIDITNHIQIELSGFGNYEEYGKLLATNHVCIQSAEDAKTIWEAFCELHFKHWQSQPAIKVSDTVWQLGDVTIDKFHYYYEVLLDEHHIVQSSKLLADEITH